MNPVASAFRTWTSQQKVESAGDSAEQALMRMIELLDDKVERLAIRPQTEVSTGGLTATALKGSISQRARELLSSVEVACSVGRLPVGQPFILAGQKALWQAETHGDRRDLLDWMVDAEHLLRGIELETPRSPHESKRE